MQHEATVGKLVHYTNSYGEYRKNITPKQKTGKHARGQKGCSNQATCWICCIHREDNKYSFTSFTCDKCGTPICLQSRAHHERTGFDSCRDEHINSAHLGVKCNGIIKRKVMKSLREDVRKEYGLS